MNHIQDQNSEETTFPRLNGFRQTCPITKPGANYGEATLFQEDWVHGKTGACGFERPSSSHGEDINISISNINVIPV